MASASSSFPLCTFCFFFFFFFFLLRSSGGGVAVSPDVAVLLEKIKPALQGASPEQNLELSTWNESLPLCLWRGLRWSFSGAGDPCELPGARSNLSLVTDPSLQLLSIHLPASSLSGELPADIAVLSSLQSLLLAVNSLSGEIPSELGDSPTLSHLDLSSNSLSGHLPPSIWNLCDGGRLVSLRLHGNNISGDVPPPAIAGSPCAALQVLDLGSNRIEGPFPSFVAGFVELRELDLSDNKLDGPVTGTDIAGLKHLQRLNLSGNNNLCGAPPLGKCGGGRGSGGSSLSSGAVAGVLIGLLAAAVIGAAVAIAWAQGRKRKTRDRRAMEGEIVEEEGGENGAEGKLVVFHGGEHLTLDDVLNATGQVTEKTVYGTVYKAKLTGGAMIELRLLREGSCKDPSSFSPAIRQLGRARHENLVPLRGFYEGKRGEKLLVYDFLPNRTLHDLLHETRAGKPLLNWTRRHKIALGVAKGMQHLHAGEVTHGSLSSKNVIVDEVFTARLAGAGVHKLLAPAIAGDMAAAARSEGYGGAPEMKRKMKRLGTMTDVYAFGILLLEILMGKKPSASSPEGDLPAVVKVAVMEEAAMEVFDGEMMMVREEEEGMVRALKLAMGCCAPATEARPEIGEVVRKLEECRPRGGRRSPASAAMYSPADTMSGEIGGGGGSSAAL